MKVSNQVKNFLNRKKKSTVGEEIGNSITHGLGVALGVVALVLMILASKTGLELMASIIFGVSIINLYIMSTLYHAFPNSYLKFLFKKFDHLSIYILIAGSYAPFLLVLLYEKNSMNLGLILFVFQWILVVIGVVLKSVYIERFGKFHLTLFLAMGWLALAFITQVRDHNTGLFALTLAGGLCYTVGAFFYASNLFKFSHTVWHVFVFAGTICHFLGIHLFLLH